MVEQFYNEVINDYHNTQARRSKRNLRKECMIELVDNFRELVRFEKERKNEIYGKSEKITEKEVNGEICLLLGISERQLKALSKGYEIKRYDLSNAFPLAVVGAKDYKTAFYYMYQCQSPIGDVTEEPLRTIDMIIATITKEPYINCNYIEKLELCELMLQDSGYENGFEDLAGHKSKKQKKADRDRERYKRKKKI